MSQLSVIIPYRDAADTLEEAVRTVLPHDFASAQVFLVDDRSTDGGPELARALANDLPCVFALSNEGTGLVAAIRTAWARSRGAFVARMDADDVALPGRLERTVARLEADPSVGAAACRVEPFADEGAIGEGWRRYVDWQNGLITAEDHRRELFVESPLCHPATVLRRAAVDAVGGYREGELPEDYDLFLRLDAGGWSMVKTPEVGLRWRHRPGRLTAVDPRYGPEPFRRLKARHLAPKLLASNRPVTVWGAGATGRRFARALEPHGVRAARFIDVDPAKLGRVARGAPIVPPEALRRGAEIVVVAVGARGARDDVRAYLRPRGWLEARDYWCVA